MNGLHQDCERSAPVRARLPALQELCLQAEQHRLRPLDVGLQALHLLLTLLERLPRARGLLQLRQVPGEAAHLLDALLSPRTRSERARV